MAPKQGLGGAGNKSAQNFVAQLRAEGKTEKDIRQILKDYGYKAGRISQLVKLTRPAEAQPAAPARALKRPAAASASQKPPEPEDELQSDDEAGNQQ